MTTSAARPAIATAVAVMAAAGVCACTPTTTAPGTASPSAAPAATAAPGDFGANVVWAARNLLGWRCSFGERSSYQERKPRWELTGVLADYGELGPPDPAGKYKLTMDGDLAINGRTLPVPAGTSNSSTFTVGATTATITSRPTGDGMPWRTLAPERQETTADDVARYKLRLADYDLLDQVDYRCLTAGGAVAGELTRRTPNAAPALEVLRPDGARIPLISLGGF